MALELSRAAGDQAGELLAARDAAAHYERAIGLAKRLGRADLLSDLHARRATALASVSLWAAAKLELEAALERLDEGHEEHRAELLVKLQEACFWLLDVPAVRSHAATAGALATRLGRGDLEIATIGWLSGADAADGDLQSSLAEYERARQHGRQLGIPLPPLLQTNHSDVLYWLGRYEEGVLSRPGSPATCSTGGGP